MTYSNGFNTRHIRDHNIIPAFKGGDRLWCPELGQWVTLLFQSPHNVYIIDGQPKRHPITKERHKHKSVDCCEWWSHPLSFRTFLDLVKDKKLIPTKGGNDEQDI